MYKVSFFLIALALMTSCGKKEGGDQNFGKSAPTEESAATETPVGTTADYDPNRGEGKFENVQLADKLDAAMAAEGEKVVAVKCQSCHKMTDEKLVGPGWKGVSQRHKPEWILNFITNPDPMIDKDPKVKAMMEICLVRMPNQALSDGDARNILEYMRQNDGVK
jgi:cytochrome c551/c552